MTKLSRTAVIAARRALVEAGEIVPTGTRPNGRTVIYSLPIVHSVDDRPSRPLGPMGRIPAHNGPDSARDGPDSGPDPLDPSVTLITARSDHASVTPTVRDHDLDVPTDWNRHESYWHFGWRRDLSVLCREVGLAGSNKAQINAASKNAIVWSMRRGYGLAAISDALRVAGRVDGRPCTVPWILHADKIDRSIVGDIDEDWLDVDPF